MSLSELLQRDDIWQAARPTARHTRNRVKTGFVQLDQALGGGWHTHALTEIISAQSGIGELSLLIPALLRLSAAGHSPASRRWIVLVAPPYIPYAPAIREMGLDPAQCLLVQPRAAAPLWAVEQALRSGTCAAVLSWPRRADACSLRRLQLAAEAGGSWGVLFRPGSSLQARSPAAIRLQLNAQGATTRVDVIKCRGQNPLHGISLPLGPSLDGDPMPTRHPPFSSPAQVHARMPPPAARGAIPVH